MHVWSPRPVPSVLSSSLNVSCWLMATPDRSWFQLTLFIFGSRPLVPSASRGLSCTRIQLTLTLVTLLACRPTYEHDMDANAVSPPRGGFWCGGSACAVWKRGRMVRRAASLTGKTSSKGAPTRMLAGRSTHLWLVILFLRLLCFPNRRPSLCIHVCIPLRVLLRSRSLGSQHLQAAAEA